MALVLFLLVSLAIFDRKTLSPAAIWFLTTPSLMKRTKEVLIACKIYELEGKNKTTDFEILSLETRDILPNHQLPLKLRSLIESGIIEVKYKLEGSTIARYYSIEEEAKKKIASIYKQQNTKTSKIARIRRRFGFSFITATYGSTTVLSGFTCH